MKLLTYQAFGLPPDVWADLDMATTDADSAADMVRAAIAAQAFVSIVGPRGAGKTRAVRRALDGQVARIVEPLRVQRERLHLGDIETAIVRDLSDESPRRSGEARSGQVRRILRAVGRHSNILLVIDDAHVLHHATLRGLKRLRELGGRDRRAALGIVLVGQQDRTERIPEVGLRSDRLRFLGLTSTEAMEAVYQVLGRRELIGPTELEALTASPRARNWLDLEALVDDLLTEAQARGAERVDAACVRAVLNPANRKAPAPKAPRAASQADVEAHLRGGASAVTPLKEGLA